VYAINIRNGRGAYPPRAFDFIAAYLIPLDVWYILPAETVQGKAAVLLNPESKRSKYKSYLEAGSC